MRLVRTSQGWLLLDLLGEAAMIGLTVKAAAFDAEGWSMVEESWNSKHPPDEASLDLWLAQIAGIPVPEASEIIESSLREWPEREPDGSWPLRESVVVFGTFFGLAAIGALALLALAVIAIFWLA